MGCSETEVTHTFSGTIDKVLVEKEIIVVKENTEDEDGNLHKVSVNNIKHYEVGQEVEVTVNKSEDSQQSQLEITE